MNRTINTGNLVYDIVDRRVLVSDDVGMLHTGKKGLFLVGSKLKPDKLRKRGDTVLGKKKRSLGNLITSLSKRKDLDGLGKRRKLRIVFRVPQRDEDGRCGDTVLAVKALLIHSDLGIHFDDGLLPGRYLPSAEIRRRENLVRKFHVDKKVLVILVELIVDFDFPDERILRVINVRTACLDDGIGMIFQVGKAFSYRDIDPDVLFVDHALPSV